jgi:hypothetical protein
MITDWTELNRDKKTADTQVNQPGEGSVTTTAAGTGHTHNDRRGRV